MKITTAPPISTPEQARRKARSVRRALAVEAAYLRELAATGHKTVGPNVV